MQTLKWTNDVWFTYKNGSYGQHDYKVTHIYSKFLLTNTQVDGLDKIIFKFPSQSSKSLAYHKTIQ